MKFKLSICFILGVTLLAGQSRQTLSREDREFLAVQDDGIFVKFITSKGNIYAMLEFRRAPMTVANFVGLAEGEIVNTFRKVNEPYYDALIFHRVIPQFMIQGGCPKGNGTGGPGYFFPDETDSALLHDGPGILSMTNSDSQNSKVPFSNRGMSNGSQFFITHAAAPWLDGRHTVFGHVLKGQEVVNRIKGERSDPRTGALLSGYGTGNNSEADTLFAIVILRKGEEAQGFNASAIFEREKKKRERSIISERRVGEEKKSGQDSMALARFENARITKSGVRYLEEKEGTGNCPAPGDQVTIFYRGTFTNGIEFDNNFGKEPMTIALEKYIAGWVEGLQTMKEGGRSVFYIPYQLAYGEKGHPSGIIPPKSDLVFEIELLKVNK